MENAISLRALQIAPWERFPLRWRFAQPWCHEVPQRHLDQIHPLDETSAEQLWSAILQLHGSEPFTEGLFAHVEKTTLSGVHEDSERAADVRKWLSARGLPFEQEVLLSWQPDTAVRTTWKMTVKYFDAFWYPGSDDLTVFDASFTWALLFHHEEMLFWGTNEDPGELDDTRR